MYGTTLVLSDGKRTAFVMKTNKGIIVHYSENCLIRDMSTSHEAQTIDIATLDSCEHRYVAGPCRTSINVNFEIMGKMEIGGEELLSVFQTTDSLSIEGLFKVIQNRIAERN
jgi:hypothetical protein